MKNLKKVLFIVVFILIAFVGGMFPSLEVCTMNV